jgi:coenzyme F420-reducing hydrogenase alpha subunit
MTNSDERTIHVPVLARVEGEGALDLSIQNGEIKDLRLRIFEPPRLFEKFLEGHSYTEVPDMVARICGICPVAYQMSAIHALESMFGVDPGPWVRAMRRVFYCGEWIQSHALHIHLLAAPDFLGFDNAIAMAKQYPEEVKRGLRLQAAGNQLIGLFGGRSVHPVGARVGGFFHAPEAQDVDRVLDLLKSLLLDAEALIHWVALLDLPKQEQDFTYVALRHPDEYAMNEGRLVSNNGLDIPIEAYEQHFKEFQVPHSTSLHATLHDAPYLVGPLARVNLNFDQLPGNIIDIVRAAGIQFPSMNMFHSIIARAVEICYALQEAIRILGDYEVPDSPYIDVQAKTGTAYGCTEAPRGVLWHRYKCDNDGKVTNAVIIPPTSQNQARIEEDLRLSLINLGLDNNDETLRNHGEMIIRNYDPCISCSTHFLRIKVDRS